ncbi:CHAP domain-containing protein [Streptococcus agalactiae]
MKKVSQFKLFLVLSVIFSVIVVIVMLGAALTGAISNKPKSDCTPETAVTAPSNGSVSSANTSIDSFVQEHQDAYIKSWKVGGFLPSASIAQTMIEVSFSSSVPSFAQAHNMGGVKWSGVSSYTKTIELFGSDAVKSSGPGTSVGDNTGGGYTWFRDFDAGIVGKAEFMSRQSLYNKAINNIDGVSTLSAIADGGWATDPSYKVKLIEIYNSLGKKYKWLDEKAIAEYGEKPVDINKLDKPSSQTSSEDSISTVNEVDQECNEESSTESASDGTGLVPSDAKAWGYKPDELPASLKKYAINPTKLGLNYGGGAGWVEHSGQCVDLTESLGNKIWGGSGITVADGWQQAYAWARKFGNDVKHKAKAGAIFSTGISAPGHTGIVCHVFQDGSVLVIEQNTPLSGITYYGKRDTWNYRIFSVSQQKADNMKFAYPDNKNPKLGN